MNKIDKERALEEFKYLWKVDDEKWLNQRKQKWKDIKSRFYEDESRECLTLYANYYVYGERCTDRYMVPGDIFRLTPFTTIAEMNKFFFSPLLDNRTRRSLLSVGANIAPEKRNESPLYPAFIRSILGEIHKVVSAPEQYKENPKVISPEPTRFAVTYIVNLTYALEDKKDISSYSGSYNYFISTLRLAADPDHRNRVKSSDKFEILFEIAEECLEDENSESTHEFCRTILKDKEKIMDLWHSAVILT